MATAPTQLWTAEDALTIDIERQNNEAFDFNVTRCKYAEMYREMGLGEIGHLLSCNRDGAFCEGYDPAIKLHAPRLLCRARVIATFVIAMNHIAWLRTKRNDPPSA